MLKAADFFRVDDDTNALCANLSNKIEALENDPTPLPYIRCTVSADQNMGVTWVEVSKTGIRHLHN